MLQDFENCCANFKKSTYEKFTSMECPREGDKQVQRVPENYFPNVFRRGEDAMWIIKLFGLSTSMSQARKWMVVESLLLAWRLFLSTSEMPCVKICIILYTLNLVITIAVQFIESFMKNNPFLTITWFASNAQNWCIFNYFTPICQSLGSVVAFSMFIVYSCTMYITKLMFYQEWWRTAVGEIWR